MRTSSRLFRIAILIALLGPTSIAAESAKTSAKGKPQITTLMYLVNRPESIASFREHADKISIVAPQTFSMDAQGFIGGEVPAEVLEVAAAKRVAVMPLVVNRGFNQPLMHTVLDSAESRARAIRYLLYFALRDGYLGFQFDYENIHYTYRDKFTVFLTEAAREFHRHGMQLSAAVVGKWSDDQAVIGGSGYENWSGVYDYKELGKAADFLSIMAYTEHGAGANPGPVAGYPWVKSIMDFTLLHMPARKISLGVPLYGMKWEGVDLAAIAAEKTAPPAAADPGIGTPQARPRRVRGRSIRYLPDVAPLLATAQPVWDENERSPHLSLALADGKTTELWYEDARSLGEKMKMASELGCPGISAWVLGQEDPAFWQALDEWRVRHPRALLAKGEIDARAKRAARMLAAKGRPSPVKTAAATGQ